MADFTGQGFSFARGRVRCFFVAERCFFVAGFVRIRCDSVAGIRILTNPATLNTHHSQYGWPTVIQLAHSDPGISRRGMQRTPGSRTHPRLLWRALERRGSLGDLQALVQWVHREWTWQPDPGRPRYDGNEATRAVTLRFKLSESWVRLIKQQRRETGAVAPKSAAPRQPNAVKMSACRRSATPASLWSRLEKRL